MPYYNTFRPCTTATAGPTAYLIPQAWAEVAELLRRNGATLEPLTHAVTVPVEVYYFDRVQDHAQAVRGPLRAQPGAAAPRHRNPHLPARRLGGVPDANAPVRYLLETLEPQATDSFFAWGFFDSVLQQKEHFSDYVFEDLAADLLAQDPLLRQRLESLKRQNPPFAASGPAQLEWVYLNSAHHETGNNRYPVARWLGAGRVGQ